MASLVAAVTVSWTSSLCIVSYTQFRNFKTPLPRVASTWRLEVTYTSFVRKVRRHFLYKHLSEHPVIIPYCSVPYVGRSYARHLQLLTSGSGYHVALRGWNDWALQRELANVSLLSETLLMAFVSWATMVQEETAALSQWQFECYIHSLYLFPVTTKWTCAPEQKLFVENLAGSSCRRKSSCNLLQ